MAAEPDKQPNSLVKPNLSVTTENSSHVKVSSIGMGLNGISDWSTQYPFLDLMKQSRPWKDWGSKDDERSFDLDNNGWIRSLKTGQTAGTIFLTSSDPLYRRYIVSYEGDGNISYQWAAKKIESESRPGRDMILVGSGSSLLKIDAVNSQNYIRNITIVPEVHFAEFQSGEIFNPDWLGLIKDFYALRFMDWMQTNDSTQELWSNRPQVNDRTWATKGVPLEIIIKLVNVTNSVPWLNIPHLADSNYIKNFAELAYQELYKHLPLYIEHSNEVWNWQFKQAQFANKAGRDLWGPNGDAFMQWHGMRSAQVCDAFKLGPFSKSPQRVKCVLGVQTGWHDIAKGAIECPFWLEGAPCYKHGIDYIGVTGYFSGELNGPREKAKNEEYIKAIQALANTGKAGIDLAFQQLNSGSSLKEIPALSDYKGVKDEMKNQLNYWKKTATKYGLGVVAYEGGQHITSNAKFFQDNAEVQQFHFAINRDNRMSEIYGDLLHAWKDGGGELFMHFVDVGNYSKWGSWGALEDIGQKTSAKWSALKTFNEQNACWWPDCVLPTTSTP